MSENINEETTDRSNRFNDDIGIHLVDHAVEFDEDGNVVESDEDKGDE